MKVKESKPLQGKEMRGPLGSNKQKINNQTLHKTDSSIIVTEARKGQSYDPLAYAVCKHRDAVISFVFILRLQKSCDLPWSGVINHNHTSDLHTGHPISHSYTSELCAVMSPWLTCSRPLVLNATELYMRERM